MEDVYKDMKFIQSICISNRDFVALLKSPIIKEDKKNKIIEAITTGRVSKLTALFIHLLASKSRESNLPEIADSFITQYNVINDIHKVKITTATDISSDMKDVFISMIKSSAKIDKIELETAVNEKLIGGFVLEIEGKLVDSSILRDLRDVQKQFMNNDYVHKLR